MAIATPNPPPPAEPATAKPKRSLRRRWARRLAWMVGIWAVMYYAVPWLLPWPEALNAAPPEGLRVVDRHGNSLRKLLADGKRADGRIPLGEIPQPLIHATLAAEDKRFWSHGGIDFLSTARALRDALVKRKVVSGASTITQQLVKISHPRPRTVWTKALEMLTARRIEMTWSKERILEEYLNRLDYGNLRTGCAAAARGYFAKPLADCSTAECALLAGLPQAPTRLNPYRHRDRAVARQRWILGRMAEIGYLDTAMAKAAEAEPLKLRRYFGEFLAPHFVDLVLDQTDKNPTQTLTTTLDLPLQEFCELMVATQLDRLREQNVTQAAVTVIDNASGEVLALVGSRSFEGEGGQVNGATARRSPGSALKPFTFLLALQGGVSPASIVGDLPMEFMTPTGLYKPKNYSGRAYGPVSHRIALANSLNLAAVRVLADHGGPAALMRALASCGITTLNRPATDYGLGLTIGGGEVRLLELTNAYATLARLGKALPLRFLLDQGSGGGGTDVFDPQACWLLADMLADNDARVRSFGTHSVLRLTFPVAVKTGTSTDYRDNWTLGFTPEYTVGVWVGNFDNSPMRGVSGVSGAGPIFRDVFNYLHSRRPQTWFPRPDNIEDCDVDPLTGFPVPERWRSKRQVTREKFLATHAPTVPAEERYDDQGRVLLSHEYREWLAGPDNWLGDQVILAPDDSPIAHENKGLRIISPLPGTTFLLDPDIPGQGHRLPLRANLPASKVQWSSATLEITNGESGAVAQLKPGRHTLMAESADGIRKETWIEVKRL